MLRILLLVILILLLIRFLVRLGGLVAAAVRAGGAPLAGAVPPAIALVACSRCGVFVPRPRALPAGEGTFLCRACGG